VFWGVCLGVLGGVLEGGVFRGVFLWLQRAYSSCKYPLFPTL
jgi:hypothetical protein